MPEHIPSLDLSSLNSYSLFNMPNCSFGCLVTDEADVTRCTMEINTSNGATAKWNSFDVIYRLNEWLGKISPICYFLHYLIILRRKLRLNEKSSSLYKRNYFVTLNASCCVLLMCVMYHTFRWKLLLVTSGFPIDVLRKPNDVTKDIYACNIGYHSVRKSKRR